MPDPPFFDGGTLDYEYENEASFEEYLELLETDCEDPRLMALECEFIDRGLHIVLQQSPFAFDPYQNAAFCDANIWLADARGGVREHEEGIVIKRPYLPFHDPSTAEQSLTPHIAAAKTLFLSSVSVLDAAFYTPDDATRAHEQSTEIAYRLLKLGFHVGWRMGMPHTQLRIWHGVSLWHTDTNFELQLLRRSPATQTPLAQLLITKCVYHSNAYGFFTTHRSIMLDDKERTLSEADEHWMRLIGVYLGNDESVRAKIERGFGII